jgi:RNA polymerase sigma-70 factor (ECF subfamily)
MGMQTSMALPRADDGATETPHYDALVVQHACADLAAFEALYRRYRDGLYRYLRARTNSDEDAADLTQQVFVQALTARQQYQARKGSVAAWLFGIARHAATDWQRRRQTTVAWEYLPEALHPDDGRDIEADAVRHESLARLGPLLAALPPDKRELLALRFAAGLTIPDIAAVIGKSVEATRKQLTRTLQTLEEQYHDAT